jgi:hypothetical protein
VRSELTVPKAWGMVPAGRLVPCPMLVSPTAERQGVSLWRMKEMCAG